MNIINKLKKIPKYFYILLVVTIILLIPSILNKGIHGDDSTFHIINITAMDKSSSITSMPPRIRPYTANNFGYGSGIFYPELIHITTLYIYKLISIIHPTIYGSIILFLLGFILLTGVMMRKLLYKITKNDITSTLGAILYITYPYFIADIYRRSAFGELISFLALPLIFLGLYSLFYENKKIPFYLYFILGYYLLFSSHLISSVYVTIFTGIFLLFQGKSLWKKDKIIPLFMASIFAILLSLNYIVPILEHKVLGNYMVFQKNYMYSRQGVMEGTLRIMDLIKPSSWLTSYIPIFSIILIFLVWLKRKEIKNTIDKKIIYGFGAIFITAILLITCPLFWRIMPNFLLTIQFPFRNCTYLGFSVSILACLGYLTLKEEHRKKVLVLLLSLTLINTVFIFQNKTYTIRENTIIRGNQRDGGMGWSKEYLPVNTYDNISYFENRDSLIKEITKAEKIKILEDDSPNLKFEIDTKKKTIVEIPRLYYLWYEIILKTKEENILKLGYYENENGFIEFEIPESGTVEVKYKKTKLSETSYIISLLSIILLICYLNVIHINEEKKKGLVEVK